MAQAPLILAPEGPTLSQREAAFFRECDPWGFIVFTRNLEEPGQIRRLTDDMRDAVGRDAPVLIDQEGGRVQRLRPPLARDWLPPLDDAARFGPRAAQALALRYRVIAAELLALGIDVNCAPTLDIAGPETHPFLRNRCLGATKARAASLGLAVGGALLEGGVLPVIKHMPGHGRGTVDSHHSLPQTDAPRQVLEAEDFAVFRTLAEMPLAMTAHMIYRDIDPDRPATQSPIMIDLIRAQIGFEGLLMTDDISMDALDGDVTTRARASLEAGCDVVLHCNGALSEMEALAEACPAMTREAVRRARRALDARATPAPTDVEAWMAEYESLA
ncbi:glycoside hydrolase family 3 N-terminal domain-containing protein [Primorskyibacter sp. S187A]|uniref:glycoside hydrolase family 3 N-terminal domain-containing protein n=1 Tax=Primorskyibacter sp. S187A TaxID=3415130 RepID=UPI003C7E40DD